MHNITMTSVQSSTLSEIGHDKDSETMHVRFKNGKLYRYSGVTPEVFEAFSKSESKGTHFGKHIRAKFAGTHVPEEKPQIA